MALWSALFFGQPLRAQELAPAVKQALSVDAVYGALGIRAPEASGYLRLELPDVALAGEVQAEVSSALPGTAWLLLLRGRSGVAPQAPLPGSAPLSPVLLLGQAFKAGAKAQASLRVELQESETFTLLAFARGRWFMVERQVKVGQAVKDAIKAKEARAKKVAALTAPTTPSAPIPIPAQVGVGAEPEPVASAASAASAVLP